MKGEIIENIVSANNKKKAMFVVYFVVLTKRW